MPLKVASLVLNQPIPRDDPEDDSAGHADVIPLSARRWAWVMFVGSAVVALLTVM